MYSKVIIVNNMLLYTCMLERCWEQILSILTIRNKELTLIHEERDILISLILCNCSIMYTYIKSSPFTLQIYTFVSYFSMKLEKKNKNNQIGMLIFFIKNVFLLLKLFYLCVQEHRTEKLKWSRLGNTCIIPVKMEGKHCPKQWFSTLIVEL